MKKLFLPALLLSALLCISGILLAQNKTGVLVMAHGGSLAWEETVKQAVNPIRKEYPAEIAFGMADPMTLQEGVNNLEKQGVNTIIVVPLFISSHSFIQRQTEYLLGLRKELADEPMVMNHGGGSHSGAAAGGHSHEGSSNAGYAGETEARQSLDPIVTKSKIILMHALDADSTVAGILFENIQTQSKEPQKETIILVAHGPNTDDDNKEWLKDLDSLGVQIKNRQMQVKNNSFPRIYNATVRDDANRKVYNEAKQHLRAMVETAGKESTVLIVPVVLALGGIEKGIQQRLEGLNYTWVNKALLPHENISKFISNSITKALKAI